MEPLTSSPETSSFIPLSVHQSRTPESFHSGPAILHYHASNCKLVALDRDLSSTPVLNALRGAAINGNESSDINGTENDGGKEVVVEGLDVWVTSDKFLLYNPTTTTGLSLTYPSISVHAIQRLKLPAQAQTQPEPREEVQGLYVDVTTPTVTIQSFPQESDEEESISMTLVPPPTNPSTQPEPELESDEERETETQKLYAAVSACSNLHPDPVEDNEEGGGGGAFASGLVFPGAGEGGGLPPPVDGSSGWITADNMHEFFDEEGNWIGGGEGLSLPGLGPGAGTVRERDEDGDERIDDVEEGDGADEETKWRRTD
ncbi:regulator of volume decrease after cellular swelling-domain-containing protein [Aspergillus cavernicola]|uniref:Regulator of volume decrease after cellular swelling-domain-containing protein n=1 Tax=Aspergillus cavernicola TaxID=176166 RepID=A0ABR4I8F0_9EURO